MRKLRFDHLDTKDGLSEGIVLAIVRDHNGFMWFGTADGLNRYDGYEFKVFKNNPSDPASISNNYIQCLYEDREHNLWIGSVGGLDKYDPDHETFIRYASGSSSPDSLPSEGTQAIFEDKSGILWIGQNTGLTRFDPKKKTYKHILFKSIRAAGTIISSITETPDGSLMLGTLESGIILFHPREETFENFRHSEHDPQSLNSDIVRNLLTDRRGTVWAATEGGGLDIVHLQTKSFTHFIHNLKDPNSISSNDLQTMYEDSRGSVWIGTNGVGLDEFHPENNTCTHYVHDATDPGSIGGNRIASLYEDSTHIFWVGTWGNGISKYSPAKNKFIMDASRYDIIDRMKNKFIVSIFKSRSGTLWLGTHGGGLYGFDERSGHELHFEYNRENSHSLSNNIVWAIREDGQGRIWVTTDMGLNCIDPSSGSCIRYLNDPHNPSSLANNFTSRMEIDGDGKLWIATMTGTEWFDTEHPSNGFVHYIYKDSLQNSWKKIGFGAMFADPDGGLIAAAAQLFHIRLLTPGHDASGIIMTDTTHRGPDYELIEEKLQSDDIQDVIKGGVCCVRKDHAGTVWIGTFGGGFGKIDNATGKFIHYSEKDGLPNNFIFGILEDRAGMLWLSTNKGISKFDPRTKRFRNYDSNDGLQSDEFDRGAFYQAPDGEMYFGGINGFSAFYPDSINENTVIPPVIITSFKKFNEEVRFPFSLLDLHSLSLTYKDNFFAFEFAALDFTEPSKNQYAYRLDGFDEGWISSGTRRYASYTHLDPGHYTFRVKGSNSDLVWNEAGIAVDITITPPFWKTWWAFCLYVAAAFGMVAGARWLTQNWKIIIASRKARYVSHYTLDILLGEGGMGKVYRAVDGNSKLIVAIKMLNPALLSDPENKKRLTIEGQLLSSFSHPNILKVYEIGQNEERAYIAMEYLTGGTLKEYLQHSFPLPQDEFIRIVTQICDGLREIHSKGVIHRDLKTTNVMLDSSANIRIMDFGLSKSPLVTMMTALGTVIGTLGYVAPEQITNMQVDQRADIFSLGVIMYELLTNTIPFKGENEMAVIHALFNTVPPPPSAVQSGVAPWIDEMVMKCMAKDPGKRFGSAVEISSTIATNA